MNIMNVDYSTKIPNNVISHEDRQVLKAWKAGTPVYMTGGLTWVRRDSSNRWLYLRTAYSVRSARLGQFDYVKMPDYRWGILLAPQEENRVIPFGEHYGEPAWQEVPGEHPRHAAPPDRDPGRHRAASVEQQRHLGKTRPRSTTCATCSRSMSRKAAILGDGSTAAEIFRPRRPRGGR